MNANKNEILISVRDLKKYYKGDKIKALDGISNDIRRGEVVCIIGPSGSGKSTFLRSLNLLEVPTGGTINFAGQILTDRKTDINLCRQKMGMVFQHFNLFPHMTVMRNMTLAPMKLLGKTQEEAESRAMQLLTRVGLADRAQSYPSQLSGGQKQRIAIVRAMALYSSAYFRIQSKIHCAIFSNRSSVRIFLKKLGTIAARPATTCAIFSGPARPVVSAMATSSLTAPKTLPLTRK